MAMNLINLKIYFLFIIILVSVSLAQKKENVIIVARSTDLISRNTNSLNLKSESEFAQELFDYIGSVKGATNKLKYTLMENEKILKGMTNGTIDIMLPGSVLRGLKYCVEYDYVPWGMVVPSLKLTNQFSKYIAIGRKGTFLKKENLTNSIWCVPGRNLDLDYFITLSKLKKLLKTTNVFDKIKINRIHQNLNGFMLPGKRHSVIQSVLIHNSDWAIVPEYDFKSYISLFPAISNKLEEIKWLSLETKLPGFFLICKRTSLNKLKKNWYKALNMHTTPAGNQYLISSGFERFCPVPSKEFNQLTNWYKILPEKDTLSVEK